MSSAGAFRPMQLITYVAVSILLTVTGCSVSIGGKGDRESATPNIPQSQLESGLKKAINDKTGAPMKSVTCDGPLKGIVGATQRCVAAFETTDGLRAGVTVTTTSVKDTKINYDFKVDDEPIG